MPGEVDDINKIFDSNIKIGPGRVMDFVEANGEGGSLIFLLRRIDCNDGVASYLETLLSGLKVRGWRITLVSGPVYEVEAAKVRFNLIQEAAFDWIVIESFGGIKNLIVNSHLIGEIAKKNEANIVHIFGLSLLPLAALLRLQSKLGIVASYVPSTHSKDPKKIKTSLSKIEIVKYFLALQLCRPDYVIAISAEVLRLFVGLCRYPTKRVIKILLGVDTKHFRPPAPEERRAARLKLGLDEDDVAIVLPGRLNWNKGHDLVIASSAVIKREFPEFNIRYIFPGTGYQAESVKRAAEKVFSEQGTFIFPGYVEDMRLVYFASDLAVLPSRHEGFALVVVEAMACGLPVIRTPSGGFDDQIFEGITGFGVPFNDVNAIAKKISILLDEGVRRRIGLAALDHSKRFGASKMVSDTAVIYNKLTVAGR